MVLFTYANEINQNVGTSNLNLIQNLNTNKVKISAVIRGIP